MSETLKIIESFGLPLVMLAGMGWLSLRAGNYFVNKVLEPVRVRLIGEGEKPGLLDKYGKLAEAATESVEGMVERVERLNHSFNQLGNEQKEVLQEILDVHKDENSIFATKKTNGAILILARQIAVLAAAMDGEKANEIQRDAERIKELLS